MLIDCRRCVVTLSLTFALVIETTVMYDFLIITRLFIFRDNKLGRLLCYYKVSKYFNISTNAFVCGKPERI